MWDMSQKSGDSISSCFFIGHRDAEEAVFQKLSEAVEQHIVEYGVTEFFVGHYGRFDALAACAVKETKKRHPEVTLTMLLPYHPMIVPLKHWRALMAPFIPQAWKASPNATPLSGRTSI